MSCRLPSPKERCPLTSWFITSHVFFRRTAWASCLSPPTAGPSQKAILSVYLFYLKTAIYRDDQGRCFSDKELNDIFYSWFGILSGLLLCSAGGTSNTVRWLQIPAFKKNKWHHLAAQLHCHIDPLIHQHFLFSARYLWLMTLLKKRNYPQIPHGKKKQESLIIYTASWPVVLYLVSWLHREHSVSVWLVAVMR